ncbi:MAG TPA: glycosyltransferase family 4 protein [Desulfobacteria bacterium]|nr:glycosyltransferase family 4 protein [Desulfobacteria bacterium]
MKVLIINTLYFPNGTGGAEKNTQMIAEELVKHGVEVVVVTTSDRDYVENINNVRVYYVKTRNLYWGLHSKGQKKYKKPLWHLIDSYNPLMAGKIRGILLEERPDVVQTNCLSGFSVSVWALLKKCGIPILHVLHDHYLLCLKTTMFRDNRNCLTQCRPCRALSAPRKKLSGLVDSVAGVSNYILKRHLDLGFFENARHKICLPNFIDLPENPVGAERDRAYGQLAFGYIGLLSAGKGIEVLLEEFTNIPDTSLLVFGKGETPEYENYLRTKYADRNIKFMGYNADLTEVFKTFGVLIVPSLWNEIAGRVVVEAYSHGLPVIASNRGGIGEYVDEAKTGLVFDPDLQGSLREKIMWFIENQDRISSMSEDCLQKAREFSKEKIVQEFINAYKALL